MLSSEADNWRCRESVGLQVPPLLLLLPPLPLPLPLLLPAPAPCLALERRQTRSWNHYRLSTPLPPPPPLMQLPDMVALFDAEVVEFDIIPIMLRLIKDPFSAGKHTHPN